MFETNAQIPPAELGALYKVSSLYIICMQTNPKEYPIYEEIPVGETIMIVDFSDYFMRFIHKKTLYKASMVQLRYLEKLS